MQKLLKTVGQLFLSLVLVAGAVWVILEMLEAVTRLVEAGVSEGSVAIVSGAATIITLAVTRSLDRREEHERALREKKAELYKGLMERMVTIFYSDEEKSIEEKSEDLLEYVKSFMPTFILWGGNRSVSSFSKFMVTLRKEDGEAMDKLKTTAQLFMSLRSEFGHRAISLRDDDIMRILVTDWDDALAKRKAAQES